MYDPYADFRLITFANGLTLYAAQWDRPWEIVYCVVHAGSRNDGEGNQGRAHFVEHLVSENVEYASCEAIQEFFDIAGGWVDLGSTSYYATSYSFGVPIETPLLREGLRIFGDMLVAARLTEKIERERNVIIEEFHDDYRTPIVFDLDERRHSLLFPGSRIARFHRTLGTPDTLRAITADDLQAFYDQYYTPSNISVVALGGLAPDALGQLLEESLFGERKPGNRAVPPDVMAQVPVPTENRIVLAASDFLKTEFSQAILELLCAVPGTVHYATLIVLEDALKHTLFRKIREERGWTYGFSTNLTNFQEAYKFSLSGGFPAEHLDAVESLVSECIRLVGERDDLVNRYRWKALKHLEMLDLSGSDVCKNAADDVARLQHIATRTEDYARIRAMTIGDVQAALGYLAPEHRLTIVLKP